MHTATRLVRLAAVLIIIAALAPTPSAGLPFLNPGFSKLDPLLQQASVLTGHSPIIVRATSGSVLGLVATLIQSLGGTLGRPLPIISGRAATLPHVSLFLLASSPLVKHIALDRPVAGTMERTGATIGAAAAREAFGYDGAGVGVAIVDSGVTSWHDDLGSTGGGQRVVRFVDVINGGETPFDDYGHGSHVAGIIAGNGYDSGGRRSGIAPAANLIVLKTLDGAGGGSISDVIAALDYIVAQKTALGIRVVNLSVGAGVYESFNRDPLTLAARAVVDAGIVVVASAGNAGRDQLGRTQYGGVMAPGNAPWVLTVGASSHMGTIDRADDTIAAFSSRGPAAIDYAAKPDIVAPGVGIESLSDPASAFYTSKAPYLLNGTIPTAYLPYLSLSGTSMAAPVVSGTVALLLQANPALTPNQIKAIVQYSAQTYAGYDPLTQGAGFLNAAGALELARYFAAPSTTPWPDTAGWGARLIWGNWLVSGGRLTATANAWSSNATWGASSTAGGTSVAWGVICSQGTCETGGWSPWNASTGTSWNVVWGTTCGGDDCPTPWTSSVIALANLTGPIVWGTDDGDTVVWGMDDGDTVVWGMTCSDPSCEPVIWGQ